MQMSEIGGVGRARRWLATGVGVAVERRRRLVASEGGEFEWGGAYFTYWNRKWKNDAGDAPLKICRLKRRATSATPIGCRRRCRRRRRRDVIHL